MAAGGVLAIMICAVVMSKDVQLAVGQFRFADVVFETTLRCRNGG